ncbi:MAG: class II fructose-bisphosphate aldolase [Candidatus Ryanbacteria bacterium]|nr:class II fructose-bisphosphate aldolase [Candidatus Ryanbacteria bacterium]
MIPSLKDILARATREHWAVPHFNVPNLEMLKAIVEACVEKRSPVMIGTSESEREFIGLEQAVALVKSYRDEHQMPFYLNADHTKSVEKAKAAIDAGYDSIHIDLSKEPLEDNLRKTKEVVDHARAKNEAISVEGEIGYLMTDSSKVYKSAIEVPPESLANPDDAARFVRETGVNRLAPAVGSIHGIALNEPHLDIARIARIRELLPDTAFVLHGGSGVPHDQIKEAIAAGISNIHISTDLRVAFVDTLRKELEEEKDEYALYKIMAPEIAEVKKVVLLHIDLFGSGGKV